MRQRDLQKLPVKQIIIALILLIALIPEKVQAACVAQELVNGGVVIITGEKHMIKPADVIEKTRKKDLREADHSDVELLANVMFHENWNTDSEHLAAYYTGAVVMNRVNSEVWPDTIRDVLYQSGQYSTTRKFFTKELPGECLEMAKRIIEEGTPDVPANVVFQSMRKQGSGIWQKVNTDYFCYQ